MKISIVLPLTALLLALHPVAARAATPPALDAETIKQNLDKIPPTDPPGTDVPKLLPAVLGKHPRLLFTPAEIADLKAKIASDPILKKTFEGMAPLKKFKYNPLASKDLVSNDTPALAMGAGQYPAMAYAYALEHDPVLKQGIIDVLKMMVDEPYWCNTAELDSSMGAACNMYMTAVLYDTVYNDLSPELRGQIAQTLLLHARRLYYLGYQQRCLLKNKYWQQDPQPNHRWYRGRAQAACLLAIIDEKGIDAGFLLQEMKKEMDFLMKWYPADGDCHEGAGYQRFGFRELAETAMIFDRTIGTQYLKHPGFQNAWEQQVYYWVPARAGDISYGDDQNTAGNFMYDDPPFFIGPHLSRDKNAQAVLLRRFQMMSKPKDPARPYVNPWTFLEFYDPTVGEGDFKAFPTAHLFTDMGAASMRDNWENDAVILTFKCGPYGGYKLNEYRHTVLGANGQPHYVNIAHDDPDANSIAMAIGDEFIFHPGVYATRKMTETISSITVDGKGQLMEGDDFTQPTDSYDMRKLSYLTAWKVDPKGRIIVEGEAGNAYREMTPMVDPNKPADAKPADNAPPPPKVLTDTKLKKYRRSTIWMPGEYILILDDIVSDGSARDIMWRGTVDSAQFIKPEEGRCQIITKGGKHVDLQILADKPFKGAIDYMYLAGRWGNELERQLQFSAKTDSIKFACLVDPWQKKPSLSLKQNGDSVVLTVHSNGMDDIWTWKTAKDDHTPSSIECKRGAASVIALTEKDKALNGD